MKQRLGICSMSKGLKLDPSWGKEHGLGPQFAAGPRKDGTWLVVGELQQGTPGLWAAVVNISRALVPRTPKPFVCRKRKFPILIPESGQNLFQGVGGLQHPP